MTTTEFRKDPERVARMRVLLEDKTLQEWIVAMRTNGPENQPLDDEITPHFAHIRLGESRGYASAINEFQSGGIHLEQRSLDAAALKLKPEK